MGNFKKLHFYNPTVGKLNFDRVIEEIFNYMKNDPEKFYEIVVGCDSSADEKPAFPVALVCLKKGQGGRFFLTKIQYPSEKKKFYNLHQRILQEVFLSCELALSFREAIKERIKKSQIPLNYQFQYIHADIGVGGPTKDMIKEVVGLIKSNGFEAKIKPEAFAASVVADRFA
jgi:hypothetical protein